MKEEFLPEISVVIPVYNEGELISDSLLVIADMLSTVTSRYEIIVVDDGSQDDTWNRLTLLSMALPALSPLRLSRNFGKEAALCAGLECARGAAVIVMDGDLQHPPELIPRMVELWRNEGYEIVECVKESRGRERLDKKLGASAFYGALNHLSGHDLRDASDYKLLDRKVMDAWRRLPERITFFRGMSAWLGFKRITLSFHVAPRKSGSSQWSVFHLAKLAVNAIVSFSTIPLRMVSIVGILFLIGSVVLGVQTLIQKFQGVALTGFTTVILLLLIIGSFVMISIGIMGEYIAAIYHEVKGRPRYLISERIVSSEAQAAALEQHNFILDQNMNLSTPRREPQHSRHMSHD
ncbi:glycosyltransferase family 2 protein [Paenibacillus swuensis]|uniref:glycosyltransferase family 2 protein n=1 Tax=Paenibacillus swuensis TaxID=1178515 RepID=UPI0008399D27|nr:glycosyltransferase family 2 protein [Paenibacillus swuensis]